MILVEESWIPREVSLKERTERFVRDAGRNEAVASQDAPGVGVYHEDRAAHGVEQDGVSGLWPDPANRPELPPERYQRDRSHAAHNPSVAVPEELDKRSEPPGLHVEGPRGPDETGQPLFGEIPESLRRQEVSSLQRRDGLLHVDPGRVLGEDSPNRHLEVGLAGPPALRAKAGEEGVVEAEQPSLEGILW